MTDEDIRQIREVVREEMKTALADAFGNALGIDINDISQRNKLNRAINDLLDLTTNNRDSFEMVRSLSTMKDQFSYLREDYNNHLEFDKEKSKTVWETVRGLISPIVLALASAIITALGISSQRH